MAIHNGNGLVGAGKYKTLYWCTTHCMSCKGFIIATSSREAKKIYAKAHGAFASSIDVERIVRLPTQFQNINELYPSDLIIKACNGELITEQSKSFLIAKRMFKGLRGRIFSFYSKRKKMSRMFQEINKNELET